MLPTRFVIWSFGRKLHTSVLLVCSSVFMAIESVVILYIIAVAKIVLSNWKCLWSIIVLALGGHVLSDLIAIIYSRW